MHNHFETYCDARIGEVNTLLTTDFLKAGSGLVRSLLPDPEKNCSYIMKLSEYDLDKHEARQFEGNCELELSFLVPNSDYSKYQDIIDDYVHRLVKAIRATPQYSPSNDVTITVTGISVKGLNDFTAEGTELTPTVSFSFIYVDTTAIGLSVPSAPTLTTPSDGGTSTTSAVILNWTGTADTWTVEILQNGSTVLLQTGLTASSFTVPADSLLSNGDYSWRARGVNSAGLGAWATAQTFTVDTAGVSYDADAQSYFTRTGVVGDTFKGAVSDFFTGLKADSLFTGHDAMWIMAAPDATTALANAVSSSYTATLIDAPTFTADQGYTGDGSNDAINTNFNLSTHGVNYTQNDAGYTLYQRVATPTDSKHWCGAWASGAGGGTYLFGANAGSVLYECNNAGGIDGTSSRYNAQGVFTVCRSSSSSINFNANTQRVDTEANTSAARRNLNMYVLALNNNGSVFAPANIQVAYFAIHRAFTAAETAKYQSRIQILMATIGANV